MTPITIERSFYTLHISKHPTKQKKKKKEKKIEQSRTGELTASLIKTPVDMEVILDLGIFYPLVTAITLN